MHEPFFMRRRGEVVILPAVGKNCRKASIQETDARVQGKKCARDFWF
jgi:hypothetical protein